MVRLKICDWDRQEGRSTFAAREALALSTSGSVVVLTPTFRSAGNLLKTLNDAIGKSDTAALCRIRVTEAHADYLRGVRADYLICDDAEQYLDEVKNQISLLRPQIAVVVGKFPNHFNVRAFLNG